MMTISGRMIWLDKAQWTLISYTQILTELKMSMLTSFIRENQPVVFSSPWNIKVNPWEVISGEDNSNSKVGGEISHSNSKVGGVINHSNKEGGVINHNNSKAGGETNHSKVDSKVDGEINHSKVDMETNSNKVDGETTHNKAKAMEETRGVGDHMILKFPY